MNWIKKNPAQLSLIIASLVVLGVAFVLYSNASAFNEPFQSAHTVAIEDNKIPPTDLKPVADQMAVLEKPAEWTPKAGSLFVSEKYLVTKDAKIVNPKKSGVMLHPPVPNDVITRHNLDITAATVLTDDVDKDGFDFLWEYAGKDGLLTAVPPNEEKDSTDPTKADSHPPYHSRLYLVRVHTIPFRLLLRSYDYDTKTKKCSSIQVNPIDRGGKTVFVEPNQVVQGTDWKFESFEYKETGDKDESVAHMVNVKTGAKLALVKDVPGNSPESFAQFSFRWVAIGGTPTKDFAKKKDETFTLDPEPDKSYKVVEIRNGQVDVLLPSGEKKTFVLTENPPATPPVAPGS
jgi:hypothetical protein